MVLSSPLRASRLFITSNTRRRWAKLGQVASVLAIDIKRSLATSATTVSSESFWREASHYDQWSRSNPFCRIDGRPSILPVSAGIPQGSSSSPTLSMIYSADLVRSIRDHPKLTMKAGIPLPPRCYRDDSAVLAISKSLFDSLEATTSTN